MPIIYATGIGPGGRTGLTEEAYRAIETADEVLGYTVYAELVQKIFPEKPIRSTPMKKERERCRMALEAAAEGRTVAMVCSGDAGVYGMAGLLYELLPEYTAKTSEKAGAAENSGQPGTAADPIEIRVIPGVTAALSGAAVLGAPLSNDFCTISRSDLMTPWEEIEKRLRCAAQADFAVVTLLEASTSISLTTRSENLTCSVSSSNAPSKDRLKLTLADAVS